MTALWEALTTCINAIFSVFTKLPVAAIYTDTTGSVNMNFNLSPIDTIFYNLPFNLELGTYGDYDKALVAYIPRSAYLEFGANVSEYGMGYYYNWLFLILFGLTLTFIIIVIFKKLVRSST